MFFNETQPIMKANTEIQDSMHYLFDYSDGPNQTLVILIAIPVVFFFQRVVQGATACIRCCGCLRKLDNVDKIINRTVSVNENLGNF